MKKMLGKRFMFLVALLVGLCIPSMATDASITFNSSSVGLDSNFGNNANFITYKFASATNPSNSNKYVAMSTSSSLTLSCTNNTYVIEAITITFSASNYMGSANKNVTGTDGNGNSLGNKFTETQSTYNKTHKITFTNGAKNVVIKDDTNSMRVSKITVTYKKPGAITFNPNSYTLALNGTQQFSPASRTPSNATVTYTSNNTSVATVSASSNRATVTAKGVGTTTITAKTASTTDYAAASADITITVQKSNPNLSISNTTTSGSNLAASVTVDAQIDLTVSGSDGTITCTGYDNSIATVTVNNTNKKITVRGVIGGETTITVNTAATSNYNAASKNVKITVNKKTDSSASLSPTSATLGVGDETQLTFNTSFTTTKSYSSNNPSVASVDANGKVKALKAGTATITATAAATSKYNEVQKTATITVLNAATATVSAENATLAVGGTTQLNVTTNSNGKKTYTSSNNNVATVDDYGKVTAKSAGTATITVNIAATQTYAATSATVQITVEGPEELDGNGATVYYIRNVSTGLYIKYGGSYGMDAIEGRAAHPFKLYSKGNNVYALASIHGYFNSMYSNSSLFLDRPVGESNWTLQLVENTSDVYYLRGENGYALASVGNQYGILELRKHDTKDIYQKWQLITEDKLFAEMQGATVADPVDITPFIKGAAFDYADHVIVTNKETAEDAGDDPFFYNEIYDLAGNTWNSTPVASRMVGDGWGREDAERSEWELTHTYSNNWDGFQRMQHYSVMWSDDQYAPSNMNLNGIGLSRNNIHNEYVVEQYIGELPAGTYTFSYQGLYHVRRGAWLGLTSTSHSVANNEIPTISIEIPTSETTSTTLKSQQFKNYTMSHEVVTSSGANKGYEVATMFRDNRENDSYRNSIEFTLTEEQPVVIRIRKPSTDAEYSGYRLQWLLAFDDFTLIYKGNGSTVIDQAILYYDRVKAAYEYYSKKVSELGVPASYTGCHLDGCVHWTAWDNAINGVVTVNGLNLRGNEYTTPSQKFAYLNGTAASNKIDTEKEFLEALSKIEAAYQAAYAEHLSHATDITNEVLSDPSFENGGTGWQNIDRGDVFNKNEVAVTGLHLDKFFSIGSGYQSTDLARVAQETAVELEPGLYRLSALVATEPNVTAYLVANGYYSGISSPNFNTFVEHSVLFLVENKRKVTIAVVGHNNPYAVDYPLYGPHYFPFSGSSFRADNFRLQRVADLPQGRVQLALAEVDAIQIDDYAKEAAFADENSLQAYRVNTYTDDAAAKTAVTEIYARFRNTVKAQKTKNADMTYAISDPSFEHGIADAWTLSFTDGDTGIRDQEVGPFHFTGTTGRKLFNTWKNTEGVITGASISQQITGIPNGRYKLTAVAVTDKDDAKNRKVNLVANGQTSTEIRHHTDGNIGTLITVECDVTDHKLSVSANENTGNWYKIDNFRLTFLHNKLELDHTKDETATVKADWYTDVDLLRPVATGKWHSFVVPYSMPVPENWDVRELTNGTIDETGTHLYMVFNRVTEMVGGTPYMVRYYPQGVPADVDLDVNTDSDTSNDDDLTKEQTNIITEYVDVNLSTPATSGEKTVTGNPAETNTLEFVGSYVPTTIPEGAIFISNNKFYVSKGTSTIKGYRGYIVPKGAAANVRSFGMHTRGGQSTSIESANNEEATVVGIYDINGIKMNEMQDGLNILRMSDGTTIKILMK